MTQVTVKRKVKKSTLKSILENRLEDRLIESEYFIGSDVCLSTSLYDNKFICSKHSNKDGSGTHLFIYDQTMSDSEGKRFGVAHLSHEDVNNMLTDWVDKDSFFSSVDETEDSFINNSLVNKVGSLVWYYGVDDVFGTDYYPFTELQMYRFIYRYDKKQN